MPSLLIRTIPVGFPIFDEWKAGVRIAITSLLSLIGPPILAPIVLWFPIFLANSYIPTNFAFLYTSSSSLASPTWSPWSCVTNI